MSDRSTPRPEHKFSFGLWTVSNRGRDPFGEAVRPTLSPVDAVAMLGEVGAWGVNLHDNDLVPIDATPGRAGPDRRGVQARLLAARHRRADGDGQPLLRSGLPRRRLHRQRSARARLRGAEDHARDGSRRRARREDLRAVGRARRHRDRRLPPARRSRQAAARRHRLPLRVLDRQEVRLPVRARGQAERAARRHLHGDDRRLSRAHPDARASGDGRREPGGRARDDGGAEFPARGRRRRGKRASCSTSI